MNKNEILLLFLLKLIAVILEIFIIYNLLKRKDKLNKLEFYSLFSIVLFQLLGDSGSLLTNGYSSSSVTDSSLSLLIRMNYRIFLLALCVLIVNKIHSIKSKWKIFFIPQSFLAYIIVLPFIYKFSIDLFRKFNTVSSFLIGVELSIFCITIFSFAGSILTITLSTHPGWVMLSAGILTSCIGAWGKRFEVLSGNTNPIVFYEFIWTVGLFLQCNAILKFIKLGVPEISMDSMHSIFAKIKTSFLGSVYLSIIALIMFQSVETATIRFVTFIAMMGTIFVILMNYNFSKINTIFLKLIQQFTNEEDKCEKQKILLPKEYRDAFEILFRKHEEILYWKVSENNKFRLENDLVLARSEIHKKVSHDIRSPLTAINSAILDVIEIPEEKRIIIKNATRRINDIANNILKSTIEHKTDANAEQNTTCELIFTILENIIAEKEYEYKDNSTIFILNICSKSYSCFSNINLNEFKIIISNLINNSIEAINHKNGIITISMESTDDLITIRISDNGSGIPHDVLPNVTNLGFSFSKKNGSGFGLYYAKQQIEKLNGKISISSELNAGTDIKIDILKAESPRWFGDSLYIEIGSDVVILDDDYSIHEIWKNKLNMKVNFRDYYNSNEILGISVSDISKTTYLIDYELIKDKYNGLDIICQLGIAKKSYLVTSNFENIQIRDKCIQIGIKIIPKPFVPYINVLFIDNKNGITDKIENESDLIISIIDDESDVLERWKSYLGEKNVFYFSHPDDFILSFSDNHEVKKTNILITDYYFDNLAVTKLIDFVMLKNVLKFSGKIFLFSNLNKLHSSENQFDYVFSCKSKYCNKLEILKICSKLE